MYKKDADAIHQGRIAYFKGKSINENPFGENEPHKEWSWEFGYNTANQNRVEYDYPFAELD